MLPFHTAQYTSLLIYHVRLNAALNNIISPIVRAVTLLARLSDRVLLKCYGSLSQHSAVCRGACFHGDQGLGENYT